MPLREVREAAEVEVVHSGLDGECGLVNIVDDDFDEIATQTTDSRSTVSQETAPVQNNNKEVPYESATDLFRAIEAGQWDLVLKFCQTDSPELKIWVKNQPAEHTTFQWSLWKRLPLHEACRRQPPAWLISAMLKSFPESAYSQTHFGQLPLHLAIDCGASPEVINLLIVSYWEGVLHNDNSGRTPLDILMEGKDIPPLEMNDQQVVRVSLEKSMETLNKIRSKQDARILDLNDSHEHELKEVYEKHEKDLSLEHERQASLQQSLANIEDLLDSVKQEMQSKQDQIASHDAKEEGWRERLNNWQDKYEGSRAENAAHLKHVAALKKLVAAKDENIMNLERQVKLLQSDLLSVSIAHDEKLSEQYIKFENDMRTMLETQVKLKSRIQGHGKALHALLRERGIDLPPPQAPPVVEPPATAPVMVHPDSPKVAKEAANAAAAAALASLKMDSDHEIIV